MDKRNGKAGSRRFAYDGLDRIIHERARLSVLTSLVTHPQGLPFTDLKRLCAGGAQTLCRITVTGRHVATKAGPAAAPQGVPSSKGMFTYDGGNAPPKESDRCNLAQAPRSIGKCRGGDVGVTRRISATERTRGSRPHRRRATHAARRSPKDEVCHANES